MIPNLGGIQVLGGFGFGGFGFWWIPGLGISISGDSGFGGSKFGEHSGFGRFRIWGAQVVLGKNLGVWETNPRGFGVKSWGFWGIQVVWGTNPGDFGANPGGFGQTQVFWRNPGGFGTESRWFWDQIQGVLGTNPGGFGDKSRVFWPNPAVSGIPALRDPQRPPLPPPPKKTQTKLKRVFPLSNTS